MSKDFQLTISERIAAVKIFDAFKGGISELATILDDVKGFVVSAEEWEKANLVKKANTDGTESWNWTDEGSEKAVRLSPAGLEYLVSSIKKKSDAGEFSLADKAVVSLDQKLNA